MEPVDAKEKQSGVYSCTLKDENGSTVSSAVLDAFLLTLHDRLTGAIINSRSGQNVLNANQVTVDTLGNVVWIWLPNDMTMINPNKAIEEHVALFEAKWTDGGGRPRQANNEVVFNVHRIKQLA